MAFPLGAAVVEVPSYLYATLPYRAYAFGGTVKLATGSSTSNTWLGFDGFTWKPIATAGAYTSFPREFASASFLHNCEGAGLPCIILAGGRTPGTAMSVTTFGLAALTDLTSLTPTFNARSSHSGLMGAPSPRHSMAAAATPDGTTCVFFGGMDDAGTVFNDVFGLPTRGWAGATADLNELLQLVWAYGNATLDASLVTPTKASQYPCNPATELQSEGVAGACTAAASAEWPVQPNSKQCWGRNTPYGFAALFDKATGRMSVPRCAGYGSGYYIGHAENAIDGNTDGIFNHGSVSRSNADGFINYKWPLFTTWVQSQTPVYFRLDLGAVFTDIQSVYLWWRTDCCLSRTGGFQVWIGNDPVNPEGANNTVVPNPFSDAVINPTILNVGDFSGRYVYVTLPGRNRVLGIAEIKVYKRRRYVWRRMNSERDVALNAPIVMSSTDAVATQLEASVAFDASLANDGIAATYAQTFSAFGVGSIQSGRQFLTVDLGAEYSVNYLQILSAANNLQNGAGVRVLMSNNADLSQATECQAATQTFGTPWTTLPNGATLIKCTGPARYVFVTKAVSTSTTASIAYEENTIKIREIKVFAERMVGLPAARSAPGFTTYGAYLVIFGGYGLKLTPLNDMRFLNLDTFAWLPTPTNGLLGRAPAGRSYASVAASPIVAPGGYSQIVLYGGKTSSQVFNDLFVLNLPACPALPTLGVSAAAGGLRCSVGGTACLYACDVGFVSANAVPSVYCRVDGSWSGVVPLCVSTTLRPAAPTAVLVTGGAAAGSVDVTWTASPAVSAPVLRYTVTPVSPSLDISFSAGYAATALFTWYNGDTDEVATNTYAFDVDGNLQIAAYASDLSQTNLASTTGSCTSTLQRCPFFLMPFPSTIPGLSAAGAWALEAFVSFAPFGKKYPLLEQFVGVGVFNPSYPSAPATIFRKAQWYVSAGIRYATLNGRTGVWVGIQGYTSTATSQWWVPSSESTPTPGVVITPTGLANQPGPNIATPWRFGTFIRLERSLDAGGQWRVAFRYQSNHVWTFGPYFSSAALLGANTFQPASAQVGILSHNTNINYRATALVRDFHVRALSDVALGFVATTTTTGATVMGLTESATYGFTVSATNKYGTGTPSVVAAAQTIAVPIVSSVASFNTAALVDVIASGKSAFQVSTDTPFFADLALDGNVKTYSQTAQGVSASSPQGDWWAVDLQSLTQVYQIRLNLRVSATRFSVLVGNTNDWKFATRCDERQIPAVATANNDYTFRCSSPTGILGRYVFVQVAPWDKVIVLSTFASYEAVNFLSINSVSVFANSTCRVARPFELGNVTTRTPIMALPCGSASPSTPAPLGAACTDTCAPGRVAFAGAANSQCSGAGWSGARLTCRLTCPAYSMPSLASKCAHTLYSTTFNDLSAGYWYDASLATDTLRGMLTPSLGSQMRIVDGVLQARARDEVMAFVDSTPVVNSNAAFKWTVVLQSGGDRVGIVWRMQDSRNYYRAVINPQGGVHVLERSVNGITTILQKTTMPLLADQDYALAVAAPSAPIGMFNVTINGLSLFNLVDWTFTVGAPGIFAASQALFKSADFTVDCGGNGCNGALPGQQCRMTCAPGITALYSSVSVCRDTGAWDHVPGSVPDASPLPTQCRLDPPIVPAAVFLLPENSQLKTFVGSPLQASLASPDYSLVFSIKAIYSHPWRNESSVVAQSAWPFTVDSCSGQITVLTQGCSGGANCEALDFENPWTNAFILLIMVTPFSRTAGFVTGSSAVQNITIQLTNIDEPPIFKVGTVMLLPENSPPNTFVGTVPFFDPDTDRSLIMCTPIVSNALFYMNGTSGCDLFTSALATSVNSFDFEGLNTRTLQFALAQLDMPSNAGFGTFSVLLTDRDDAPLATLPNGQNDVFLQEDATFAFFSRQPGGSLQIANFTATDQDVATFALATPTFTIIPAALQSKYAACALTDKVSFPTLTGDASSSPLFTITPGNLAWEAEIGSRVWSLAMSPSLPTGNAGFDRATPFYYTQVGVIAKAVYRLCLNNSDSMGAWAPQAVDVVVNASTIDQSTVILTRITWTGGAVAARLNTNGEDRVDIQTVGACFSSCLTADLSTAYKVYVRVDGSWGSFTGPQCTLTALNSYSCAIPKGTGFNTAIRSSQIVVMWERATGSGLNAAVTLIAPALLLANYVTPTVTGISMQSDLPTAGWGPKAPQVLTAVMVITGTNFGPQTNDASNMGVGQAYPTVVWGPSFALDSFTCIGFNPSPRPQTELYCRVGQGVGLNLSWSVFTNPLARATGTQFGSVAYAPPLVRFLVGVKSPLSGDTTDLNALLGRGGQEFFIQGDNFGPYPVPPAGAEVNVDFSATTCAAGISCVQLIYTPAAAPPPSTLIAASCVRDIENTRLRCTSPPGYGVALAVVVTVGSQPSLAAPGPAGTVKYAAPLIQSMSGAGMVRAATNGGASVLLQGVNFGPAGTVPDLITYGHAPADIGRYVAVNCVVRQADVAIQCTLAPGVGAGLSWLVNLGEQLSNTFVANTSYSPPIITGFSGDGILANTDGGDAIVISGINFGPADAYTQSLLSVYYDTKLVAPIEGGTTYLRFPEGSAACTITTVAATTVETITCTLAPGAGADLMWHVIVDSQLNIRPTTAFSPPVITRLADMRNPALPLFSKRLGAVACPSAVDLTVACGLKPTPECLELHLSDYIANCICTLPIGVPAYTYCPLFDDPAMCAASLNAAYLAQATSQLCAADPDGGGLMIIEGELFGPLPYNDVINGGGFLDSLVQSVTYGPTGREYAVRSFRAGPRLVSPQQITVELGRGYGKDQFFRIKIADIVSVYADETAPPVFNFASARLIKLSPNVAAYPALITVNASDLPSTNDYVTTLIVGNLVRTGPLGALRAWETSVSCDVVSVDDEGRLQFALPIGAGGGRFVQIRTAPRGNDLLAQFSRPVPAAAFTYAPPRLSYASITKAVFIGGSSTRTDLVPCPFPAWFTADKPAWNCNNPQLMRLTVYGAGFGELFGDGTGLSNSGDGVSKTISFSPSNGADYGPATTQREQTDIWLFSWSWNTVVAYTLSANGTINLETESTGDAAGAGTCTDTQPSPDANTNVRSFSGCSPSLKAIVSVTLRVLSPEVTALSWTPAETGTSPCVRSATSTCTAPTAGAVMTVTLISINVDDVIIIHLGDPNMADRSASNGYFGASLILFTGYAGMVDATSMSDLVVKQLELSGGTSINVRFKPPPAQGISTPIVVERTSSASGFHDYSSASFSIVYATPVITTFDVVSPLPTISRLGVDATSLFATTTNALTSGLTQIKIRGTNLGVAPSIFVGGMMASRSGITDCSAFFGTGTCWALNVPSGQGSGRRDTINGAEIPEYAVNTDRLPPLAKVYDKAAWGPWPGGYNLWFVAGSAMTSPPDPSAQPLRFTYDLPVVARIVSLNVAGTFPAAGGSRVSLLGLNFGNPNAFGSPTLALASITVELVPGAGASGRLKCTQVTRTKGLSSTAEGIDCTLPAATPGSSYHAYVAIGDLSSTSATTLLTYDSDPLLTNVTVASLSGVILQTYDFTATPPATMVRAPTDGAWLTVCGKYFGPSPVVYAALTIVIGNCTPMAPLATDCCVLMQLGPGEGKGSSWYHNGIPGFGVAVLTRPLTGQYGSVLFAYNAPRVTAAFASNATYPTAGGKVLTIVGENFGTTMATFSPDYVLGTPLNPATLPSLAVGDAFLWVLCANVIRFSSTLMSCILPESSGKNRRIQVNIDGQISVSDPLFNYDSPYLVFPYVTIFLGAAGSNATLLATEPTSTPGVFALAGVSYTTSMPVITDQTQGGSTIQLHGQNFGPSMLTGDSCVFMAWAARPPGLTPDCDGRITWLGEGQVPRGNIVSWSQTLIVFTIPPGLGWKEIGLNAGGNLLSSEPGPGVTVNKDLPPGSPSLTYFRYQDPVIERVGPRNVNTDGITEVTLYGRNFGPSPNALVGIPEGALPDVAVSDMGGSAFIVIRYNYGCLSLAREIDGSDIDAYFYHPQTKKDVAVETCTCALTPPYRCPSLAASRIISITHDRIRFVAPSGIGANRTMSIHVVEPTSILVTPMTITPLDATPRRRPGTLVSRAIEGHSVAASNNTARLEIFRSAPFDVGYLPPQIDQFSPQIVYLPITSPNDRAIVTSSVQLIGSNFGRASAAAQQEWTSDDTFVAVWLEGVPCLDVSRRDASSGSSLDCTLDASQMHVGFPTARLTVAGQTSSKVPSRISSALVFVCDEGSYGQLAAAGGPETCIECPFCLPGRTPCASCPGFVPTPYNLTWLTWDTAAETCNLIPIAVCQPNAQFCNVTTVRSPDTGACLFGGPDMCVSDCLLFDKSPGKSDKTGQCNYLLPCPLSPATSCTVNVAQQRSNEWYLSPCFSRFFHNPESLPGFFNLDGAMYDTCEPAVKLRAVANFVNATSGLPQSQMRKVCIVPCDPSFACLGANQCAVGYVSKLPMYRCASCDVGYFRSGGGTCAVCPNSPYVLLIGIILLMGAVAGLGYWLNKRHVNLAVVSIGIDFFQVLAIFANLRIQWPPVLRELWNLLSAFNLNINIVAPECLVPNVSYKTKFTIVMCLPLIIGAFFIALYLANVVNKYLIKGIRDKKLIFNDASMLISSLLLLMYLMYLYLTREMFNVFICAPTTPPDGNLYLAGDMERCTVPVSGTQAALIPLALFSLLGYTVAYPCILAYNLYKNRELVMEDQLLRAKGVGNDKMSNPNALWIRQMFGRSYFQFKPQYYAWVLVIIARKLAIAVTATFNRNPAFQMAACLLIIFVAYSLQVQLRPYMSPGEYEGTLKLHEAMAATDMLHARLKVAIADISTQSKKRVTKNLMDVYGKVDRKALMGILGGVLMNYNTVEAVMLFATAVVCVCALMFVVSGRASREVKPWSGERGAERPVACFACFALRARYCARC